MKNYLFIICVLFGVQTRSQTQLQLKYNNYKTRLNTEFCVVGSGAGQSIPSSTHKSMISTSADSINHWGDATIQLGWYIGVLATEYEIKKLNSQNTAQTLTELYYAIKTINRLDSTAEVYYGGASSLNGFFIRDDVSPIMIAATNSTHPLMFNSDNCLVSNYACGPSYCVPITTLCVGSLNNEESQDQFYHLLIGLSLCAKYCDIIHNGLNLSTEAKAITNRLISYIKQNNWIIKNAVTGNNVSRGENATSYSHGIALAGLNITGNDYSDATTTGITAQLSWNAFPTINFPTDAGLTNDNVHMFLATAAVANDIRTSVDAYATLYNMPIYPLLRQVLYGGPNTINDTIYTNLLNKMDPNSNYYYSPTNKSTGGTWYSENMFVWPARNAASAAGTNTLNWSFGEYAGIDFMLLHNLMEIKQLNVGIKNYTSNSNLSIYPNPTNGIFTISSSSSKATSVMIYGVDGTLVYSKSLNPNQTSINIEELANGIYIYKIASDHQNYKIGKLVKGD